MIAYLASFAGGSIKAGDGKRLPALLNEKNGFLEKIRSNWKPNSRVLIISAGPEQIERNDLILDNYAAAFPMSGLSVSEMTMCDSRNEKVMEDICEYDVLLLAGGHVPTQNAFFEKWRLRERLQKYDGMIIGNSAGTMNCAEIVYAQPELEGESVDEAYQRFLPGLGLTKAMTLPHYQLIKDDILDGKRVFEDITYPDSVGKEFYALVDGSYLTVENGVTTLYGEAYLIKGGVLSQVCGDGESMEIVSESRKNVAVKYKILKSCIGCRQCYRICPVQAIITGPMRIDSEKCIACGKCYHSCPSKKIIKEESIT